MFVRRSSGAPSPESNVTLALNGFRDARFVAVDGITEAATFSFLVRSATGWRGNFRVPLGKLRYAFIVDGTRKLDLANAHQEDKWDQDGTKRFSVRLIAYPRAICASTAPVWARHMSVARHMRDNLRGS